jgi:hypothetical protein
LSENLRCDERESTIVINTEAPAFRHMFSMCLAYICTAMADEISTLHAPRKSSQRKKKNLTWTWWAMFCWRRSFNNRAAGVLLIVAIYVSICMCVHNVRKTSEIKQAKKNQNQNQTEKN